MADKKLHFGMSTCQQPARCLIPGTDVKYPLILLNQPFSHQLGHLKQLWANAVLRAATDGANNTLYDLMNTGQSVEYSFVPDLVTGDFDSIRPEVKSFMQSKGAEVIATPDQDYTDFTKCLKIVTEKLKCNEVYPDCLVAFGAFGGRLDHTLSNLNTLYEAVELVHYPVYLIGDYNLSILLMPGSHVLEVNTGLEEGTCGLIPIGGKCNSITTTGLKWNLDKNEMKFGGLISSCNKYKEGATEVSIETDSPVLWTMSLKQES